MRLIAVMCFYDEPADMLAGAVASLKAADVSHLVCVDGAYQSYPLARAASPPVQRAVIAETCAGLGLGLTLHVPCEPWLGDEVAKRSFSLRLACASAASDEDWLLVFDADHFVRSAMGHLGALAEFSGDAASVSFADADGLGAPMRLLYRALPGLCYDGNHYTVVDMHGRNLCAGPALELGGRLQLEHRPERRSRGRVEAQRTYYRRRDELGLEQPARVAV